MISPAPDICVAADVGGTTTRIVVFDARLDSNRKLSEVIKVSSDNLRHDPVESLGQLVRGAVPKGARLAGVVIGLPSMFDAETRVVQSSPNIPALEGHDLGTQLASRLDAPVLVERETVLLTTGEWIAGAARGFDHVLGVFVGTGIGGAMLIGGRPYRGASGAGVEIGHVPVRSDGVRCICGNRDCLEAYASGHVLASAAEQAGIPVDEVFTAKSTRETINLYVEAIGHAVAAACNLLDPELLLIGGGLGGRESFPFQRILTVVNDHLRKPSPRYSLQVRRSSLGSQAIVPAAHHLLATTGKAP